jgi:thiamine kinase-like enzyme
MQHGRDSQEARLLWPVVRQVWPDAPFTDVQVERVSHRRNAEHWRTTVPGDALIIRVTDRTAAAERIAAALTALAGAPFAPRLRSVHRFTDGRIALAMEDIPGAVPTSGDIAGSLPRFVAIIRDLHRHEAFQQAVAQCGRGPDEDGSRRWAEEEWQRVQRLAPADERVRRAAPWLDRIRRTAGSELADSIRVAGHGDLHAGNWRLSPRGPVLLDWEEVRSWSLANELADFIVFGGLDPQVVADLYGVPRSYRRPLADEAAACAVSFYLHWLRTTLDGSDPRAEALAEVELMCQRLLEA